MFPVHLDVCLLQGLLQILEIVFYLFIWPFCYILSIPISCFRKFCFPCMLLFICHFAFSNTLQLEFSFSHCGRSSFVCIAWFCLNISWVSFLLKISFGLFLPSALSVFTELVFYCFFFIPLCPCVFFVWQLGFLRGIPILLLTSFPPLSIKPFTSVMLFIESFLITYFSISNFTFF